MLLLRFDVLGMCIALPVILHVFVIRLSTYFYFYSIEPYDWGKLLIEISLIMVNLAPTSYVLYIVSYTY